MALSLAARLARPALLRATGLLWLPAAALTLLLHFGIRTRTGLTAGDGTYAFGDDTINFWAAARLALEGRAAEIYDFARFHLFQTEALGGPIHLYHYSYPPVALLVTLPLGAVAYPVAVALWVIGGWLVLAAVLRAAWPVGATRTRDALLMAAALPAALQNAMTGQTGTWMAAVVGGGLALLPRRPALAGAVLALLVVKPHFALGVPIALLAARHWTALAAFVGSGTLLLLASAWLFGPELWLAYADRANTLRAVILEDGEGVWHLMISVFVAVRQLPASVPLAYAVQGVAAAVALVLLFRVWRRDAAPPLCNTVLVMAMLFVTPYLQVYDLVVTAFVPVWLLGALAKDDPRRHTVVLAAAPMLIAPLAGPALATATGFGFGVLLLLPMAVVAARIALSAGPSQLADRR